MMPDEEVTRIEKEDFIEEPPLRPSPAEAVDAFRYALLNKEIAFPISETWYDDYLKAEKDKVLNLYHYHLHITSSSGKTINFIVYREEEVLQKFNEAIELILDLSMDTLVHKSDQIATFRSGAEIMWLKCEHMFKCFYTREG